MNSAWEEATQLKSLCLLRENISSKSSLELVDQVRKEGVQAAASAKAAVQKWVSGKDWKVTMLWAVRIFAQKPEIEEQSYLVTVKEPDHNLSLDKEEPEDFTEDLTKVFGEKTPADLCYVFEEWEYDEEVDEEEKKEDDDLVKK